MKLTRAEKQRQNKGEIEGGKGMTIKNKSQTEKEGKSNEKLKQKMRKRANKKEKLT
jgi:hypothetical protein